MVQNRWNDKTGSSESGERPHLVALAEALFQVEQGYLEAQQRAFGPQPTEADRQCYARWGAAYRALTRACAALIAER